MHPEEQLRIRGLPPRLGGSWNFDSHRSEWAGGWSFRPVVAGYYTTPTHSRSFFLSFFLSSNKVEREQLRVYTPSKLRVCTPSVLCSHQGRFADRLNELLVGWIGWIERFLELRKGKCADCRRKLSKYIIFSSLFVVSPFVLGGVHTLSCSMFVRLFWIFC